MTGSVTIVTRHAILREDLQARVADSARPSAGSASGRAGKGGKSRLLARLARKSSIPKETNRGEATKDKVVAGKDIVIRMAGSLAAAFWSGAAAAQSAYADPAGSSVIVSAVRWLEGTLLGTIATVVAVIAVASVGLLMLTGRINWRYGATVILGCFILFGAASIVAGIQSTASLGH
jgi:type IV secretion system protein VirB2